MRDLLEKKKEKGELLFNLNSNSLSNSDIEESEPSEELRKIDPDNGSSEAEDLDY